MRILVLIMIYLTGHTITWCQEPVSVADSSLVGDRYAGLDSLVMPLDSVPVDSLVRQDSLPAAASYPVSADAIDVKINYGAVDSQILDNVTREAYLYGAAYVEYGTMRLEADYIKIDLNNNIASAEGVLDTAGQLIGTPVFKDGAQEFDADRMRYNFKTRRGVVYDVRTVEGDLQILGAVSKFHGKTPGDTTSTHKVFSSNALFTTCDHDVPHFGIRSKKQKIIAGKLAVVGPSNLEIGGVPTPLYLPFGFFPLKKGKRSGLMFPNNYEYSDIWGFGLANIGYYFPINDYLDFTLLTDLYLRGSYRIDGEMRYRKRYRYNGTVSLGYSNFRQEQVVGDFGSQVLGLASDVSYSLRVAHRQDPKAHPYRSLNGSINIETNNYQNLNNNSAASVLNNSLSSNFALTQIIPNSPFTVSLGLRHQQNTQTRDVSITLPAIDVRMKQINPFRRSRRVGPEKWYEQIVLQYNGTSEYRITAKDSTLFEPETFDDARFGIRHRASLSNNLNVLKYFQLTPSVNLTETWYTKSTRQWFRDSLSIRMDTLFDPIDDSIISITPDTTSYGRLVTDRVAGFNAVRQYDLSLRLATQVFGTMRFNKGWLRGIRHTMKPSISMNFSPDYTRPGLDYFDEVITRDNKGQLDTLTYSRFAGEIYGGPSQTQRQFRLNYGITNLLEAKTFRKRDSSLNKSQLFNNMTIGGSYNFSADSLQWSPISFSTNLPLMKGMANIQLRGSFDPYATNENGTRINTFEYDQSGKLLRLQDMSASLNVRGTLRQLRELFSTEETTTDQTKSESKTLWDLVDNLRFDYQFILGTVRRSDQSVYFEPRTNNIRLSGAVQMSPKWVMSIGNIGYDFVRESTTYPDFTLARDLHCWNMGVSWQPERATYSFFIRVKPGSLDFINVPYNQNRVDGFERR